MDHEVAGFVGNRLQEALWREALHMIDSGEATVAADRRLDRARPRAALGLMGPIAHVPPRRRPRRHGAHAGSVRPGAAGALDETGRAAADPGAARPSGLRRRRGRGRADRVRAGAATRRVSGRPAAAARASIARSSMDERPTPFVDIPHRGARASGWTTTATCTTPATDRAQRRQRGAVRGARAQLGLPRDHRGRRSSRWSATSAISPSARSARPCGRQRSWWRRTPGRFGCTPSCCTTDGRAAATGEYLYLHVDTTLGATTPCRPTGRPGFRACSPPMRICRAPPTSASAWELPGPAGERLMAERVVSPYEGRGPSRGWPATPSRHPYGCIRHRCGTPGWTTTGT